MKFYTAQVVLCKTVHVEVSAVDDQAAAEAARAHAQLKYGTDLTVEDVLLSCRGESSLDPGTRVRHDKFGPGVVSEIAGTDGRSWRLEVRFDSGDIKHLHAPHPSLRPEAT